MNGPAVAVENLRVSFGPKQAVDGLSFTVAAGSVFGLLGPNGAGKTTTVETLEGYRKPTGGTVRVLGLDPLAQRRLLAPRIGVMLQEGGVYPGLRPREALRLFASYYEHPDDPDRLLGLVGLADAAGTVIRRLSGGQKQRLSLALALVGRPEVAFLDEPTAGMDPHARHATWDIVRALKAAGVTVVLTTHVMDEAERLCDEVAIIDHGRLLAQGSPVELTRSGGVDGDGLRFSAAAGLDVAALAGAIGLPPADVVESPAGEYTLAAGSTPEVIAALTAWLRDHDVALGDLSTGRRTLEEVYLNLTRERDGGTVR